MSQYKNKFRVWDIENQKMLSGKQMGAQNLMIHPNGDGVCSYTMLSKDEFAREDDNGNDYMIMRWTGLSTDKSDIYESDILLYHEVETEEGFVAREYDVLYIVEWLEDDGHWIARDPFSGDVWDLFDVDFDKVVGNIYENPKLLDVK